MHKVVNLYDYKSIKSNYGGYLMNNNYFLIYNDNIRNIKKYNICNIELLEKNKKIVRVLLYNYNNKFVNINTLKYEPNIHDDKYDKWANNFFEPFTPEITELLNELVNAKEIEEMLEKKKNKSERKLNEFKKFAFNQVLNKNKKIEYKNQNKYKKKEKNKNT